METLDRVKRVVAEELQIDWRSIRPDDDVEKELAADSLHMAQIVMALEEEFSIRVPDEEATKLKTVSQISGYVDAKMVKEPVGAYRSR